MMMKRSFGSLETFVFWVLCLLIWARAELNDFEGKCLSWRLNVEVHNHVNWWTVPDGCRDYVRKYMECGQYDMDLSTAMDYIVDYSNNILPVRDGFDAWILDVDDTALSNLEYYAGRKYGGMPYDPDSFKAWSSSCKSVAIPQFLELYMHLNESGFQLIFLSGRDESMRSVTQENLISQGYTGYTKLILRGQADKGNSAVIFKSRKREELLQEGYRIWGNVGDQWSDLAGVAVGARTFKIPNPMYFVP